MAAFDSKQLVDDLIARVEPRLRKRFAEIILLLRRERTLDDLAALIAGGRVDDALAMVTAAGARLAAAVNVVFLEAGEATSTAMGKALSVLVDFDQTNVRAIQAMQRNRLGLIQSFTAEQRDAVHQALIEGIHAGKNPIEQARDFRDAIGLTPKQQRAVANYRRLLESQSTEALKRELRDRRYDTVVQRAIRMDNPLSAAQIDTMVTRYAERSVKYRSEVIARDQALMAVHEGAEEAFAQAIESGNFTAEEVRRQWHDSDDSRVRDSHGSMDGQVRRVGEPFISGLGNRIPFPGAPGVPAADRIQCRCRVSVRVELPEITG